MHFARRNGGKEHHLYRLLGLSKLTPFSVRYGQLTERTILAPGSKPPRGQRMIQPLHSDRPVTRQRQTDMLTPAAFSIVFSILSL